MIVREHLKPFGPVLIEASDGLAALKALDESQREGTPFDLGILDYHMPNMDGLDLARALREREDCASLPLVIYASDMRGHASERARKLGIASYVYKPVSRKRLLESLAVALNQTPAAPAGQLSASHPESASLSYSVGGGPGRQSRSCRSLSERDPPINWTWRRTVQ
ncbi:MAG: hypothetical protein CV089_13290 [Nitrospira sp. WS110]|nr:hypothetical protein [Nitrospira sp. WS110]